MSVFGIAIGGSLGASREDMHEIVRFTRASLRDDKPVHLLGIGGIRDVFHGVRLGIDTFDCVHPTRLARHAGALVRAHHWYEAPPEDAPPNPMELARIDTRRRKEEMRLRQKRAGQGSALEEIFEEVSSPLPNREREQRRVVREHIHLDKASMRGDSRPIDASCDCYTCRSGYSRGYLHHLFKAKELSGATLVTIHNIHFMNRLMADIRYFKYPSKYMK
jgi:queuine tRNA-ribosyltransferase